MRVLVLGANGKLGHVVAERLAASGHEVRGFVRRIRPGSHVLPRLEYVKGDALLESCVIAALSAEEVVINTIGSGTLKSNTVETDTTRVVLSALQRTSVTRYIAMSAGMVAPVSFVFDHIVRPLIFANVYREHREVEALVRASGLDWTIIRPPKLRDGPARGYTESASERPAGPLAISRTDVADFLAKVIAQDLYHRQAVFVMSR
jgi:uncharacterized protein YbjT (DUF2867 family)